MKTERRHELQTNQLADWLGTKLEQAQRYSTAILASVVAIVVIAVLGFYLANRSANQKAALWDRYYEATGPNGGEDALESLADSYPKTNPGDWARYTLGELQLSRGVNQLFEDRAKGKESLTKAVENLKLARDNSRGSAVSERAALGLGRAYESLDQLDEARQEYEQAIKRESASVFAAEARERLADLNRKPTKGFYDWFAQQETKPPLMNAPGVPGLRPDFNPHTLPPDEIDLKLRPSKSDEKATDKAVDDKILGDKILGDKGSAEKKAAKPPEADTRYKTTPEAKGAPESKTEPDSKQAPEAEPPAEKKAPTEAEKPTSDTP